MAREKTVQRHKNKIYFKDQDLDLYLQAFPLNHLSYGGAAAGEVFYAASRIREKDPESWVAEWSSVAARLEAEATKALERDHVLSARESFLRAFTYRRTVTLGLRATDPRFREGWETMRRCFRQAAELFEPPIQTVEIPYEGGPLPGYFVRADAGDERRPTAIVIGGGEQFSEELYFWGGAAAVERGYNALVVDMPAQGGTPLGGCTTATTSRCRWGRYWTTSKVVPTWTPSASEPWASASAATLSSGPWPRSAGSGRARSAPR
jgi:hypothetical protein